MGATRSENGRSRPITSRHVNPWPMVAVLVLDSDPMLYVQRAVRSAPSGVCPQVPQPPSGGGTAAVTAGAAVAVARSEAELAGVSPVENGAAPISSGSGRVRAGNSS